jgi:hypothetical protein
MTNQQVLLGTTTLVEQELQEQNKAGSPLNLLRWASLEQSKKLFNSSRLQIPILGE